MTKQTASVLLAAGGTGGHLFPAQALAEELARRGIPVDLVTDMRGDRYGTGFPARSIYRLPSATLASKSPVAMARTAVLLSRGLIAAFKMLGRSSRGVVVGFGGYPTFPPLKAASLRGIPTAIARAERRARPRQPDAGEGRHRHRHLVRGDEVSARRTLVGKSRLTGNPVALLGHRGGQAAVPAPPSPMAGCRCWCSAAARVRATSPRPCRRRWRCCRWRSASGCEVVQQARAEDAEAVAAAYRASGIAAEVSHFFADLPERMAKSQLVVARSGASTVAELTVIGRPAILVPLPHALDNDQLQNASRLAESGAAWCIEQKDLSPQRLARDIGTLLVGGEALAAAADAAKKLGRPDAVGRLADLTEELDAFWASGRLKRLSQPPP